MYRKPRLPSHGPFCRKRSFETNCKICGAFVLYWECIHGVKVLFDLPIYGKPLSHRCPKKVLEQIKAKSGSPKYGSFKVLKTFQEFQEESAESMTGKFRCPVCNNRYTDLDLFLSHIHEITKRNEKHRIYFIQFEYIPRTAADVTLQQRNLPNSEEKESNKNNEVNQSEYDFEFDQESIEEEDLNLIIEEFERDNLKKEEIPKSDDDDFFNKFGDLKEEKHKRGNIKFDPYDFYETIISDDAKKNRHFGTIPLKKGKYVK